MSGLAAIGVRPDHDLHVLIEGSEKLHQTFDGKLIEAIVLQGRNLWLRHAEQGGDFALFELPRLEPFVDGQRQARLGLPYSGIGIAQIDEDVGGSAGDPGHGLPLLW